MSWENLKDAYRTRLGNLTAKSVLVLIVDEANAEGLAIVSDERVCTLTEINKRTMQRIVQVFELIGLVSRTEAMLKGRVVAAFQVDIEKLGTDLRQLYAVAYAGAQRKPFGKRRSDAERSVAATRKSVAATQPPHPLIGKSPLLPFVSPTPVIPASGDESVHKLANERAIEGAVDQVMSALNIPEDQRRKRKLIRGAIKRVAEKGESPATIALDVIAAVREQSEKYLRGHLKFEFGLQKFLGEGIWRDHNRWAWDVEAMQRHAQASVGTRR